MSSNGLPESEDEMPLFPTKKQRHRKANPSAIHSGVPHSGASILTFAFENLKTVDNRWTADCLHCPVKRQKSDRKGTTSNFLSHVRQVHGEVYEAYLDTPEQRDRHRRPVNFSRARESGSKKRKHQPTMVKSTKKQDMTDQLLASTSKKATDSASALVNRHAYLNNLLIHGLILEDTLPLPIAEKEGFRRLLSVCEPSWLPLTQREIVETKLPKLAIRVRESLQASLATAKAVSLTMDFRSRGRFRGAVVGLTGHAVASNFVVTSELLAVNYFGDEVVPKELFSFVDATVAEYGLTEKAFVLVNGGLKDSSQAHTSLPGFPDPLSEPGHCSHCDAAGQFQFYNEPDQYAEGEDSIADETPSRVASPWHAKQQPSFAYTFHLVIRDGLDACRQIPPLVTLLTRLSRIFAAAGDSSLKEPGTEWMQQLKWLRDVLNMNAESGDGLTIVDADSLKEVKLDGDDMGLLRTFVDVMRPFEHAAVRIHRGTHATISSVAPHISGIYRRLLDFYSPSVHSQYLRDPCLHLLVDTFKLSIELHFGGLLCLLGHSISLSDGITAADRAAFGSDLYLAATFLDPTYKDYWVEEYVPEIHRKTVEAQMRSAIRSLVSSIPLEGVANADYNGDGASSGGQRVRPDDCGLDSFRRPGTGRLMNGSIETELTEYYQDVTADLDMVTFWTLYEKKFPRLSRLVRQLMTIPANSTKFPFEFSEADWKSWAENEAGLSVVLLREHRQRLGSTRVPSGIGVKNGQRI